ncbi:MAG: hypothetical protein AAGE76_16980, partial [Pseudomonadota bacterium]
MVFTLLWRQIAAGLSLICCAAAAAGQPISVSQTGAGGLRVQVEAPADAPRRIFVIHAPPKLVLDVRAHLPDIRQPDLRAGRLFDGWSRVVADLPGPQVIARAAQADGRIAVTTRPATEAAFRAAAALAPA